MIGHELAQCRVIHDQGRAPGPQHKSSQKIISDERDQGRTEVPKQRKEYRKKDLQLKHVEGYTDKLTINASGGAKAGSLLGHTAPDKPGGVEDDFADMPSLEDVSDHESRQGLPTHTSDFLEMGTLRNSPAVMQAKGSESHAPFDAHHVEVLTHVVVSPQLCLISTQRVKSPVHTTTLTNTPIDGHHEEVSTIVPVPSPSLVLKNHFSSLNGLDTTDVGGDPYIGTSTAIVEPQKAKSSADIKAL